ncbi:MAG: serine--tRNA ligase [Egibacteraceae bacterium]
MIDIRLVRDDTGPVAAALARRGVSADTIDQVRALDEERRALITEGDRLRAEQKARSKEIGAAAPEDRQGLIDAVKQVSTRLDELEPRQVEVQGRLERALAAIPNLPHPDAPDGADETDAVQRSTFGTKPTFDFAVRDHMEIGEALGLIDVVRAVKVSGSRFAYLLGQAVLLEFSLVRYALDRLMAAGHTPVIPPVLTREEALFGTAFLPGGAEQLYEIPKDDLFLVGTAEVPLAGLHLDEILAAEDLPVRYAGFSTCFRREAGTYGKDTRGIFRMHQFDKVEMFSFVAPEDSEAEHQRLLDIELDLFTDLGLHGRVVDIPVGDLGDSAARKFDIEVWLPGQEAYRELTSASNCTDYQARRLRCRYRVGEKETALVHTLNGTAIAMPRAIIALLETHQQADGSVAVPAALQPYLGAERIG